MRDFMQQFCGMFGESRPRDVLKCGHANRHECPAMDGHDMDELGAGPRKLELTFALIRVDEDSPRGS